MGSFSSNVEDNIHRTCKKVGLIFASNFDRCKVNLLVYVKLWKQACLPDHYCLKRSFGRSLLLLERCQYWFLKHIFYVPELAHGPLLLKLSGLNSIESEVATEKLSFSGRLITEHKMRPLIKDLFDSRTKSFFDSHVVKFDLFYYFET